MADIEQMRFALDVLAMPGEVHELRLFKTGALGAIAGVFNDVDRLAEAARGFDTMGDGTFVTLNPVDMTAMTARLAKAKKSVNLNEARTNIGTGEAVADSDILRRAWLFVDLDPERAGGDRAMARQASSDAEHQAALAAGGHVREAMMQRSWPAPVLADSGNGCHLLWLIDEPNDEPTTRLIERVLKHLSQDFSGEYHGVRVNLDTRVANAGRLIKLYGSTARKGDATAERPHRLAVILDTPPELELVSHDQLEETGASSASSPHWKATVPGVSKKFTVDVAAWLATVDPVLRHGVDPARPKKVGQDHRNGGEVYTWEFDCPFDPEHRPGKAFLRQHGDGTVSAGCQHDSCNTEPTKERPGTRRWGYFELRELWEPGWQRPSWGADPDKPTLYFHHGEQRFEWTMTVVNFLADLNNTAALPDLFHRGGADRLGQLVDADGGKVGVTQMDIPRLRHYLGSKANLISQKEVAEGDTVKTVSWPSKAQEMYATPLSVRLT